MFKKVGKLKNQHRKEKNSYEKLADQVMMLEEQYASLTDEQLRSKTDDFKKQYQEEQTTVNLLVDALAVAREMAKRSLKLHPYKVQVMGAIALYNGTIAEMKTGEGKTLTAALAAYVNAIEGKGVHIVTVNEYLASRDAQEMGVLYNALGLTVGINLNEYSPTKKKEAFACDITYTTNNELGFDYLRDNMVVNAEQKVLRGLFYAIVDEVDSVLVDEARTPLIISGGKMNQSKLYHQIDVFVKSLTHEDYAYDEETKAINLTESGINKAEDAFSIQNLYSTQNINLVQHIGQSLKANHVMARDIDYVVANGEIKIVDKFTGRIMEGRAYSEGLHQAIEAKEGVSVREETKTLATITFQNFFNLYQRLSGMTGTAKTEEEEFIDIYNLKVIEIPTNMPIVRVDNGDYIFASKQAKWHAVVEEIKHRHEKGQPVLVGTTSVEDSELLSEMLKRERIKHELLNAKNNLREADIVAKAGQQGSVTISTNMAGRGTDIKLGEGVSALGGLFVLGTEKHESRRIDNQLRGRSGRQGDPGETVFFISLEDEIMIRFGGDRMRSMITSLTGENEAIQNKTISKTIISAQKRVEGQNYDIRKNTVKYDNVLQEQRRVIYTLRNRMLDSADDVSPLIESHIKETVSAIFANNTIEAKVDHSKIYKELKTYFIAIKLDEVEQGEDHVIEMYLKVYISKHTTFGPAFNDFQKNLYLKILDDYWMNHLNTIALLREGIFLRSYAQVDPLVAYEEEAFLLFEELIGRVNYVSTSNILRSELKKTEKKIK